MGSCKWQLSIKYIVQEYIDTLCVMRGFHDLPTTYSLPRSAMTMWPFSEEDINSLQIGKMVPSSLGVAYWIGTILLATIWFHIFPDNRILLFIASVFYVGLLGFIDDLQHLNNEKFRSRLRIAKGLNRHCKAFMPLLIALPAFYIVQGPQEFADFYRHLGTLLNVPPSAIYAIGFGVVCTLSANIYNMLGGLHGLESCSGLIMFTPLLVLTGFHQMLVGPLLILGALSLLNALGTVFVSNVGTYSIGASLGALGFTMQLELPLLISFLPHILNSVLILLSNYLYWDYDTTDNPWTQRNRTDNGVLLFTPLRNEFRTPRKWHSFTIPLRSTKRYRSLRTLVLSRQEFTTEKQVVRSILQYILLSSAVAMVVGILVRS